MKSFEIDVAQNMEIPVLTVLAGDTRMRSVHQE
jgi:hypothetical protein